MELTLDTPAGDAERRAALTTTEGLRRWWDPDAVVSGGVLTPGWGGPDLRITIERDTITWRGASGHVAFRPGSVEVDAGPLDPETDGDVRAGWSLALLALERALRTSGQVHWLRAESPVALSYDDAWTRLSGPGGLAHVEPGTTVPLAGPLGAVPVEGVLRMRPRAIAVRLPGDALLRLQIGPGVSVNAVALCIVGAQPIEGDWERWLRSLYEMGWKKQEG